MIEVIVPKNTKIEVKEFLKLAIPLASAQVAQASTGFVDTIMMGWLGKSTLAAGALASITFFALLLTVMGVVMAVSPLLAEAYGAKNMARVRQVTIQGLWLAFILAIPMMLLMTKMSSIMIWLGQEYNTTVIAKTYLDVILWGFFPALGFVVLRSLVSAFANTRPVIIIVVIATIFNAIGNYVLGFGKFGFPEMGLAGLALASTLSHWLMFVSLGIYIFRQKQLRNYHIFHNWYHIQPILIQELVILGIPLGVSSALETGLFTVVTYLMGILGTEVLAAHQIVFQTIVIIFMVPLGMSFAATVRVGQWNGQDNLKKARLAGYVSMSLAGIFMLIMAVVLLLYPEKVMSLYIDINQTENAHLITMALPMFTIAALSQILDGVQKTASASLQGLKDTRVPMLLSCFAFWGIGLSSGYLLGFPLGFGGAGLWLGQSIGVAVSGGVFIWRFHKLTSRQPTRTKTC